MPKKKTFLLIFILSCFLFQACVTLETLPKWSERDVCTIYSGTRFCGIYVNFGDNPIRSDHPKNDLAYYPLAFIYYTYPLNIVFDTLLLPISVPFSLSKDIYYSPIWDPKINSDSSSKRVKFFKTESQVLESISKDYVHKSYYGQFNPYGTDRFITYDKTNNLFVEIIVRNNTSVVAAYPIGKLKRKNLEVFYKPISIEEVKRQLGLYVDKKGNSLSDNYTIIYKLGQTAEEYHLEQYR